MSTDLSTLSEPISETEDPVILHTFTNVLCYWAKTRPKGQVSSLPIDFARMIGVTKVVRQPIGFVRVHIQFVDRSLQAVQTPYEGGGIDDSSWPSDDLFKLSEFDPAIFPEPAERTEVNLRGREEIEACPTCNATCSVLCPYCRGSTTVSCAQCGGTHKAQCAQCSGAGAMINARGRNVNCSTCKGYGHVTCHNCDTSGQAECTRCSATGAVMCEHCDGCGRLKTEWKLKTATSTVVRSRGWMAEQWQLPMDRLIDDAVVCQSWTWKDPVGLTSLGTDGLGVLENFPIQADVGRILAEIPTSENTSERRLTGVRLEVLASHAFQVGFEYKARQYNACVGAANDKVFPCSMPTEKKGALPFIARSLNAFWNGKPRSLRESLSKQFYSFAASRLIHFSDDRCIVPPASRILSARLRIVEGGYELRLPSADPNLTQPPFHIGLDVDEFSELALCTRMIIGPAHRDAFPKAMMLNRQLEFGRICVSELNGVDTFCLIDCRAYSTLHEAHYAKIIRVMAAQLLKIAVQSSLA